MHKILVCVLLFVVCATSIEINPASQWKLVSASDDTATLNLVVAIKQQNTKALEKIFWEVSTPDSPKYGKYLTADQVSALVMPKEESIQTVTNWLVQNGVKAEALSFTRSRDFVSFQTTVAVAKNLLQTTYSTYSHVSEERSITKANSEYVIPSTVKPHVDFVVGHTTYPVARRNLAMLGDFPPITPVELRNRYNVPSTLIGKAKNNSLAVAEFQAQYFSPSDLSQFFKNEVPFAPQYDTVSKIVGQNTAGDPGTEANLDIQFIMGVAPNISAWFWSNPSMDFFSDITTWLTQIDNTPNAPWVHSVSYGSQSIWPTDDVHSRVDTEFQKSGARGISIIFASGDSGTGCEVCIKFKPSWPASSQYVTSVGATQFVSGNSGDEAAVSAFGSGGGFSPSDPIPSYQSDVVSQYFTNAKTLPESFYYTKSGRGTPDVSALGIGFQVYVNGAVQSVGGTSASAPTFAAVISLLNDVRFQNGKSSLGFLNPWLYSTAAANPTAFNDVTSGNNRDGCCGFTGFQAAVGWDPVTGLGTPNFAVLSKLV